MFMMSFLTSINSYFKIVEVVLFFKSIDFHMALFVHFLSIYLYLGRVNRP
jgi:hypothetical protein